MTLVSDLWELGAWTRRRRRYSATVLAAALGCAPASPVDAQISPPAAPSQAPRMGATIADAIAEASQRFGIPAGWIAAVMRAESAFDPRATSPKGAMGLMQLMPHTWAALRARLALGADPYEPHDNILAGAGYLRDLYHQFGAGGFLAAYNAGPGRYLDFLTRGRPLPAETRAYVATISRAIAGGGSEVPSMGVVAAVTPPRPGLFVALAGPVSSAAADAIAPSGTPTRPNPASVRPDSNGLFVGAWGGVR